MLGAQSSGIRAGAEPVHLRRAEPGRGHDQRHLLLKARFQNRFGRCRHREINHHVDGRRQRGRQCDP
jgi:hypothetical protein